MANEYLKRTPTSTGNRKVWTWSGWVKRNSLSGNVSLFSQWNSASANGAYGFLVKFDTTSQQLLIVQDEYTARFSVVWTGVPYHRDASSWLHFLVVANSTITDQKSRIKAYINGAQIDLTLGTLYGTWNQNDDFSFNHKVYPVFIGAGNASTSGTPNNYFIGEMVDTFFVDGQALTPDVFGFYKVGKGYISAGSAQSTDFRPGQWVPKTPRVIKTAINNNGGFGVNGFYLPMNDSNNFGADFHCEPNSIIKLQENLPQPRCRIDGVGDYTGALRDDPFKQYLIYAQPNVLGGLQNGYGDYSHIIRGSGSPKTITGGDAGASGTPVISTTQSLYYGSSLYFDGSNDTINVETNDSNYLGRDFTIEFWVWMDSQATQMAFNTTPHPSFAISLNRGGSGQTSLFIGNGSNWQTGDFRSGGVLYSQQWNHVAVERYNNAITIYHNGAGQGTTTAYMPTGFSSLFRYGTYNSISGEPLFGYIQDYRVYSGVAKYKGGFDVPRPYTPVGIATWRAVPDSPANNFATLNPLVGNYTDPNFFPSDGNLSITVTNNSGYRNYPSTFSPENFKGYLELRWSTGTSNGQIGITDVNKQDTNIQYTSAGTFFIREDGNVINGPTTVKSGCTPSFSSGDTLQIAFDFTGSNKNIWFGRNGTWGDNTVGTGNPSLGINPMFTSSDLTAEYRFYFGINTGAGTQIVSMNFGQNPTFSGNTTAGTYTDSNNKGLFKYQPPSGFLALCEDNLPTPAISDPGKYFKTVLYTGDGASGRSITGIGFQPDFVWIKARTITYNHRVFDSVRGAGKDNFLMPNLTVAEGDSGNYYGGISSFDADGFSMVYGTGGSNIGINESGQNYVAWCWKAGAGTTSTNTNGSITSVVSVNQDAGFSIVSYTGNGTSGATVGHGINKPPKFIIVQTRQGTNNKEKPVYHVSTGTNYATVLNGTSAGFVNSAFWNNTAPSSSLITLGNDQNTNQNTSTYIAYCWAEIEGYSKFGSYTGNGSADGPSVYCGFRPAWVMIKSSSSTENWNIFDNVRKSVNDGDQRMLFANTSDIEGTNWPIDFLSNGFKNRYTGATNYSGVTYIFAAYAESPFQTANAK